VIGKVNEDNGMSFGFDKERRRRFFCWQATGGLKSRCSVEVCNGICFM